MTRETIAADLLGLLAPLLASLLVALASLPAVEGIRARLAPKVPGVHRISRPRTSLGLATQRWALLRRRLDEPRSRALPGERRPQASASRPSPSPG